METQQYVVAGSARLTEFLEGLMVEKYWLRDHHIVWQTGQQNAPIGVGRARYTHCSAFAAAACMRLGIYLLRPPFHDESLLASAQDHWLRGFRRYQGETAEEAGWIRIGRSGDAGAIAAAQKAANSGQVVLASYAQRPAHDVDTGQFEALPGHIAILRPPISGDESEPHVCAAGHVNSADIPISESFSEHVGAWPGNIDFYMHASPLEHDLQVHPAD